MNIIHSRLDLQELGYIDSYELSGTDGELVHEFPPLKDDEEAVALAVVDGASAELLRFDFDNEPLPPQQYQTRRGRSGETAVFPQHRPGLVARFLFPGGKPIALHFAVFRRVGEKISDLIDRALNRFKDPCWACKQLVKFVVSLMTSGGSDEVAETGLEFLWDLLPDCMTDFISESQFGELLGRVTAKVREWLPKNLIANYVCQELGYCPAA